MNILITGYNGFIGSNLTVALSEHHLIGVDLYAGNTVNKHIDWSNLNTINTVDCIIHLAGKAHDTKNSSTADEYYEINVGLTKTIFGQFLKSSATKFIFFSSVKAVADSVVVDRLTEEVSSNPLTPYGRSKLEAEKFIINEFDKWKKEDLAKGKDAEMKKVYILRPCMIYGPGNKGNLNLLFKVQQKGLPWPLGAFDNKRSFCSIDNILFVIKRLIDGNIEDGIYQVADDEALSTNELIRLIALSQNKNAKILNIPVQSIKAIARIGDMLHLPLNSERLKKLTESYLVSNNKLKNALGIAKMPYTVLDCMNETLESFKQLH